ncbi:hypothetical protein Cpar_0943 [Chlorobaculum parvum NCIB 8327]|uniref:Glycine zipper domain-containing protein n=1 Tax=Chlorobaculum parvum (strain DSM 263 / NCIMB 8327) TaxID=517417 RepID=B3QN50_CHLP8|nr:hypothetical protein [Chlorobaculum parvum]ACF11353.1 hypothetical protein Cpar_0943 [Chlorobaculum parvum NCIB 8327]
MKKSIIVITLLSYLVSMSGCTATNQAGAPDSGKTAVKTGAAAGLGGFLASYLATGDVNKALRTGIKAAAAGLIVGYIVGEIRAREYKSSAQIYREKPVLAKPSSASMPPRVTSIVPTITDTNNRPLRVLRGGQQVWLGTKYQLEIPKYSNLSAVDVVEINILTDPDGLTTRTNDMKRTMRRQCGGVDAGIQFTLPRNAKEGIYTHTAIVQIEGREPYKVQRKIQVVKVDGVMNFYAVN